LILRYNPFRIFSTKISHNPEPIHRREQPDLASQPRLIVTPSETDTKSIMRSLRGGFPAIWLLTFCSTVIAHTWVEEVRLIASNGSFVGQTGYARAYVGRDEAGFSDFSNQNKFLGDLSGPMCQSKQTLGSQNPKHPELIAAPKDQVALRYLENGHVTKPNTPPGKPLGRGTVFIYGTTKSSADDTYNNVHRQWNTAGTGGNRKGKLLATRPFDDGRCFQANQEPTAVQRSQQLGLPLPPVTEIFCQADFQIPADAPTTGLYTVYWVWEWPTLFSNGAISTNESYTSCIDISMTSNPVPATGSFDTKQVVGNGANAAAIPAYLSTQFSVDPTALPQVAPDTINPAPVPPGVHAPAQPAAAAPQAASAAVPAAASSSSAGANQGAKLVTVTVTERPITTVTVTEMVPIVTASKPSTTLITSIQTADAIPSEPSSVSIVTGKPVVTPFLRSRKRAVAVRGRPVMV
jgi:hypothetical protein